MACLAVCGAVGLQPNGPAHGVQAVGQHPAAVGFVLNGEIPAEKIQQIIAQAQLVPAIAGQIAPGHAVHIVHAVTVQRQLDHRKVGIRLFPEPRLDVIQAENHIVAVIHVLFMGNAVLLNQIHAEQLVPHVVKPRIHVQFAHVFGGAVLHRQGLGQGPRQLVSSTAPCCSGLSPAASGPLPAGRGPAHRRCPQNTATCRRHSPRPRSGQWSRPR